jgi:hypothetical protein
VLYSKCSLTPEAMRSRRSSACSNGSREEAVVSSTCSKPRQSSSSHHKSNLSSGRSIGVGRDFSETVVVAIDATREITKHALEWALTNVVVQSGEIITLLAVLPTSNSSVRRIWGLPVFLPLFGGDCSFHYGRVSMRGSHVSVEEEVHEACSLMLQQVHMLCTSKKVNVRVKVVQAAGREVTAMESRKLGATWVVLDRHLKKEGKFCKDLLQCNIVLVKSEPKILRLNLKGTGPDEPNVAPAFVNDDGSRTPSFSKEDQKDSSTALKVLGFPGSDGNTPSSSPDDIGTPFTPSDHGTFSNSNTSSEQSSSPYATSKPGNRSPEMSVRGAILEAATADFIEHGGSYTVPNFDSDEDKSPEVVRRVSTSLRKSFDGNVICQFENMTRNSGSSTVVYARERMSSRLASKAVSRSRSSSRRGSPVKSLRKTSPLESLDGNRRQSFEGWSREARLGQGLRVVVQESIPAQHESLSDLFKPGRGIRHKVHVSFA